MTKCWKCGLSWDEQFLTTLHRTEIVGSNHKGSIIRATHYAKVCEACLMEEVGVGIEIDGKMYFDEMGE